MAKITTLKGSTGSTGTAGTNGTNGTDWTGQYCRVKTATQQSITKASDTAVVFVTKELDTNSFADLAAHSTRITIPAGMGGVYLISYQATWPASNSGLRDAFIRKNGSTVLGNGSEILSNSSAAGVNQGTLLTTLAAGDYIELIVNNSATGSQNTPAVSTSTLDNTLSLIRIS